MKTASVFGVLPGATDENVAVMAHTDSFFEGAMDNASGIATMVALAEHYAKIPKAQRRRTMTFFTTSAHHSPSGENAGARWVHNNMKQMFAKTALLVNCEHTAQVATFLVGETLYAIEPGERAPVVHRRQRSAEDDRDEGLQGLRDGALLASRRTARRRARRLLPGCAELPHHRSTPCITPTWTR